MKKKIVIIMLCLLIIPFIFAACDGGDKVDGVSVCKINGIDGVGDAVINHDKKTVSFAVDTAKSEFDISAINRSKDVTVSAFEDKEMTKAVSGGKIALAYGENTFYVNMKYSYKKNTASIMYTFIITRIAPAVPVEPTDEIDSIKAVGWAEHYEVNDALKLSRLEVTKKDLTKEFVDITADMLTGFDTATVGTKTVTITYKGKTVEVRIIVKAPEEVDPITPIEPTVIGDAVLSACINDMCYAMLDAPSILGQCDALSELEKEFAIKNMVKTVLDGNGDYTLKVAIQNAGITEAQLQALAASTKKMSVPVTSILKDIVKNSVPEPTEILPGEMKYLLGLFEANDPRIEEILAELKVALNGISSRKLGVFAKQVMDIANHAQNALISAKVDLYNDAIKNSTDTALVERLRKQLDFYVLSKNEYAILDEHTSALAKTVIKVVDVLTTCDLSKAAKFTKIVFQVVELSQTPGNEAKIAEIFKENSSTVTEIVDGLNEAGNLLENLSNAIKGDTFSKLMESRSSCDPTSIINQFVFAMSIIEDSAGTLLLPAAILQNIIATDVTTMYAEIDALIKIDKNAPAGTADKQGVVVFLRAAEILNRTIDNISEAKLGEIKTSMKKIMTVAGVAADLEDMLNEKLVDKIFTLLTELKAYKIDEVVEDEQKINEIITKIGGLLGSFAVNQTTFESDAMAPLAIKKGMTNEEIIKSINMNICFELTEYVENKSVCTPVLASPDNVAGLGNLTNTGFKVISISIVKDSVTYRVPIDIYVYDDNSRNNFVAFENRNMMNVKGIQSCAIGEEPVYPIDDKSSTRLYMTYNIDRNGWVSALFSNGNNGSVFTVEVDFSISQYTSKAVTMIYDTATGGLKTGYLVTNNEILGEIIMPFQYFVKYAEVVPPVVEASENIRRTFSVNSDPIDYGNISYTEDSYNTKIYEIKKEDITGLDLTTVGIQEITVTANEIGKTFVVEVLVMPFETASQITDMHTRLAPGKEYYLKGATVCEQRISISFKDKDYNMVGTIDEINEKFKNNNFNYTIVFNFDTATVGRKNTHLKFTNNVTGYVVDTIVSYTVINAVTDVESVSIYMLNDYIFADSEANLGGYLHKIDNITYTLYNGSIVSINNYFTNSSNNKQYTGDASNWLQDNATITFDTIQSGSNPSRFEVTLDFGAYKVARSYRLISDNEKSVPTKITVNDAGLKSHNNKIIKGHNIATNDFYISVEFGYGYSRSNFSIGDKELVITGLDVNTLGNQTMVCTYFGQTSTYNVEVITQEQADSIVAVTSGTIALNKSTYKVGEAIDLNLQSVVTVVDGYNRREWTSDLTQYVESTTFDSTQVGKRQVLIKFKGSQLQVAVEIEIIA